MNQILDIDLFLLVQQQKVLVSSVFSLLGQLWIRKKAQLQVLWRAAEQALALAFTPRTEVQRAELAIRAGELMKMRQTEYHVGEVNAGVVFVATNQAVSRIQGEQLKSAFRSLSGIWKRILKTRNSRLVVTNRTRMIANQKLEIAKNDGFCRLKCCLEANKLKDVEEFAFPFYSKVASVSFRIRNQRMRLGFSSIRRKTQLRSLLLVFGRTFTKETQGNTLFSIKKIIQKVNSKKKKYESASCKLTEKLKSLLFRRLKCVKTCFSLYIGADRCAAVLKNKAYERRAQVMHILLSLYRSQANPQTMNFLYINQALRSLPDTQRAFKNAISTALITAETFQKQGLDGKAVNLIFEYGLGVFKSGLYKYRREELISTWTILKTLPKTRTNASVLGRKLPQLFCGLQSSLKRSGFAFFRNRSDEFACFQTTKLGLSAYVLEKTDQQRERFLRLVNFLAWKNAVETGKKGEKSRKKKTLALSILSRTGKRTLRSNVTMVLRSQISPLLKERSLVFQRIITEIGIRRHMRNALFSIETRVGNLLKIEKYASGLVRILKKEAILREIDAFYRIHSSLKVETAKSQLLSEAKTQEILKFANVLVRLVSAKETQGLLVLRQNLLFPSSKVARFQRLIRIFRLKHLKVFNLKAKIRIMLLAFDRNRNSMKRSAFVHWRSEEYLVNSLSKKTISIVRSLIPSQQRVKSCAWKRLLTNCFWEKGLFRCFQALEDARNRSLSIGSISVLKKLKARSILLTEVETRFSVLTPTVQKCEKSLALRRWKTYMSQFHKFQELVSWKFSRLRKMCCRVNLMVKLESMREILSLSEAKRKSINNFAVLMTSKQRHQLAQAFHLMAGNKLIYPETTLTKLVSAKRLGAILLTLHKRVFLYEARNLLTASRQKMSKQRHGLKLCLRSWNGVRNRLLTGYFQDINTTTWKDSFRIRLKNDVTLIELSKEKDVLYRLLPTFQNLRFKREKILKSIAWRRVKWSSIDSDQWTELYQRRLILLKRTLLTVHTLIERPSMEAALTHWKSSKPSSELTISSLIIQTAFQGIKRALSYRLPLQTFEAIRAASTGKDEQQGFILLDKIMRKSHVKRTAKALRFDFERTVDLLKYEPIHSYPVDETWQSTKETGSETSSPFYRRSSELTQKRSSLNYSMIVQSTEAYSLQFSYISTPRRLFTAPLQKNDTPVKRVVLTRTSDVRSNRNNREKRNYVMPFAVCEALKEPLPLYSSPYYPYNSFVSMQHAEVRERNRRNKLSLDF